MGAQKRINSDGESAAGSSHTTHRKLDTCGCCFLCLTVVEFKNEDDDDIDNTTGKRSVVVEKTKNKSESQSVSLKSLRRHLKIDTGKLPGNPTSSAIIGDIDHSAPSSLKKEEDIKVDLCKSCAKIVNKFSSVFSTLEMIQVEVHYWLGKIHQQIPDGEKDSSSDREGVQNYNRRRITLRSEEDAEKMDMFVFVDELRKEIGMKCSKLKTNLEAKVELDSTKIPAKQHQHSATVTVLILPKDEPLTNPVPSTSMSFKHFVPELTSEEASEESELKREEDAEYFPLLEEEKGDGGNISESSSSSSSSEYEDEEKDKEYFPVPKPEEVVKPSKHRHSVKSVRRRGHQSGIGSVAHDIDKKMNQKKEYFTLNSKTGKFNCTVCHKAFKSEALASVHYEAIHLKRRYECELCGVTCSTLSQLNIHKKNKHGDGGDLNSTRKQIAQKFPNRSKNPVPKGSFNPDTGKYRCRECPKEFNTHSAVLFHFEANHTGNVYKCDICNVLEFKRLDHFKTHQKICRDSLRKRLAEKERREADPIFYKFPCPTCGKRFQTQDYLGVHLKTHESGRKYYACDICQKQFLIKFKLNEHKQIAHFGKRFYCKICGKKYRSSTSIRNHERECAKKNPNHPSLLQDKDKEGEDVSKVEMCVFNSETGMFDCSACQKTFKVKKCARIHYGSVHLKKGFLCDLCGKCFGTQNYLNTHRKKCTNLNQK